MTKMTEKWGQITTKSSCGFDSRGRGLADHLEAGLVLGSDLTVWNCVLDVCSLGRLPGPRAVSLGLPMLKHDVSSQRNNIFDLPSKLRSPWFSLRPTSGVQGVHWFKAETKNRVSQNWGLTIKGICDKFGESDRESMRFWRVCMGANMQSWTSSRQA